VLATGDLILSDKTQVDLRAAPGIASRPPRPAPRAHANDDDDEEETAEVILRTGDYESVADKKPIPGR
jgi:hypothetical protein